jgi:hypothetical protein
MRKENEMTHKLSVRELRAMGFDWPKHALIEEYCFMEHGKVDLDRTLQSMQSSRSFYRGQINQAFNFKQQTGADYSDFTDRFDEYSRRSHELGDAIAYIEEIIEAVAGSDV